MSASLKRRRTSQDTYVAIDSFAQPTRTSAQTPTPKRASYLSPTKASLARTNPHLLQLSASAKKSRESEPNRRQSLRDAILGNKSMHVPEATGAGSYAQKVPEIVTTTKNPNEDQAVNIPDPELGNKENEVSNTSRHDDISNHAPSLRTDGDLTPRRNHRSYRFASPKIVPQLVDSPRRQSRRSASAELELPPTPVQLGKDKLPDRPRGLSSSSPGGRNKHQTMLRGGNGYSSPTKLREMAPILSEEYVVEDIEIASGLGDDHTHHEEVMATDGGEDIVHTSAARDAEDDPVAADMPSGTGSDDGDADVLFKTAKLQGLQVELEKLQKELEQLQACNVRLSKSRGVSSDTVLTDLGHVLKHLGQDEAISKVATDRHTLFQRHSSKYLNLFVNSNLLMTYETWEKKIRRDQKFVYETTFTASKPWPPETFSFSLETMVDWNTEDVESVSLVHDTKQNELRKWTGSRLQEPVTKCDPSTLVTGAGRFFEASIKRARAWKALIEPHSSLSSSDNENEQPLTTGFVSSQTEALSLLPYLFKTQHGFSPADAAQQKTRRSLGSAKQLMLIYDIDLDWVGRTSTKTEILLTGFSQEVVDAAKQLYSQLEPVGGVVRALNGVRDILEMSGSGAAEDMSGMRKKKGKARRVTVFN